MKDRKLCLRISVFNTTKQQLQQKNGTAFAKLTPALSEQFLGSRRLPGMANSNECVHCPFEIIYIQYLVGHLTRKSGVLGSIPGLATYFRFSFRFFKKGSCQLLAKVCARSTG